MRTLFSTLLTAVAFISACTNQTTLVSAQEPAKVQSGTTWTPVALNQEKETVNTFVVGKNKRILAATSSGVMISDNQGLSWSAAKVNPDQQAAAFSLAKDDAGNFYAGLSKYGVLVSTDNGNSWTLYSTGLNKGGPRSSYAMLASGNRIFKGTQESGVYVSDDKGKSWNPDNNGIPLNLMTNRMVSVMQLAKNAKTIYALTDLGVRYSNDNGKSWNKPAHNGIERLGYMSSLAVSNANLFAGVTESKKGVFLSTDNGENWKPAGLEGKAVYALAVIGGSIYAGADGNIYRSDNNGKTWATVGQGLPQGATIYSIGITADGKLLTGLNRGGIYVLK
jgi:photosystem II stability/assembly factor-like uncharacterized protein